MKNLLFFVLFAFLVLPGGKAHCTEFVCVLRDFDAPRPDVPDGAPMAYDRNYETTINICDSETSTVTNLIRTGAVHHVEVVHSGDIYFVSDDYEWAYQEELSELWDMDYWEWEFTSRYVKRLPALRTGDNGFIEYGEEQIIYEVPLLADGYPPLWNDFEVRTLASGEDRIYFSMSYSYDAGEIFYIDEDGEVQLYYSINPDELLVPSCDRLVGYWRGNFAFDDDNNLYLSSGNHVPSYIYRIAGAGQNFIDVDSLPEIIHEHSCTIGGIKFSEPDVFYFNRPWAGRPGTQDRIFSLSLGTSAEEIAFLDPTYERIRSFDLNDVRTIIRELPSATNPKRQRINGMPELRSDSIGGISKDHKGPPDIDVFTLEYGVPDYFDNGTTAKIPIRVFLRNAGGEIGVSHIKSYIRLGDQKEAMSIPFVIHGQKDLKSSDFHVLPGNDVAFGGSITIRHPQGKSLLGEEIHGTILSNGEKLDKNLENNTLKFYLKLPGKS